MFIVSVESLPMYWGGDGMEFVVVVCVCFKGFVFLYEDGAYPLICVDNSSS